MAIEDVLNDLWGTNKKMDAVFAFRAAFQDAFNMIEETIANIDRIVAESDFSGVDQELLSKGQACREALNDAKLVLNDHTDFIDWRPPSQ